MGRPSGTVTFLFTDIEGSTRMWESDPDVMRAALVAHDEVLRAAIESRGGWLFKHTGDGVCAVFSSAPAAVEAAIAAQRVLELPVRMGVGTGSAELRRDDYFGPALNRAARVMAAGHGGQILVAASTAAVVDDVVLVDLGEHRLRDLSGSHRLFQVRAPGLGVEFPPLRTLDAVPGNLPLQTTSFVGRDTEVGELVSELRAHRLVTLTGVAGVGKTRLAVQVAGEVVPEFPGGVWLVELAPVRDPSAVPDAVATRLGIRPRADVSMVECVADGLAGHQVLVVLDNCEHVLDAAAELVEAVLARSGSVKVLATSREGLRVSAEHLWPVPPLGVLEGVDSAAVALFVERARAVAPRFGLGGETDADAVAEICRRLDGIALAIELAAARMVSMSLAEVRDRLGDRFRLLAGGRRGLERHQTLRHAVQWSYDLLTDAEQVLLNRCSVFAGGFDLSAAVEVCGAGQLDEFAVLDVLDSLVRKSLVVADKTSGTTRYALLETIRRFAEDQLTASGAIEEMRDRHGRYFSVEALVMFERWVSPRQRDAFQWLEAELGNLRSAFRWSADRNDLDIAATIASRVAVVVFYLQSFEPIGWAEELLDTARRDRHRNLAWLYLAASLCYLVGRADDAVRYGEAALALIDDPRHDPVLYELVGTRLAWAYLFVGRPEKFVELCTKVAATAGPMAMAGTAVVWGLATMGRFDEAMVLADRAITAAESTGIPFSILYALDAYGKAFAEADPVRALAAKRRALAVARDSDNRLWVSVIARELAGLEATHGDPRAALDSFEETLDSFHRSGDTPNLAATFGNLVVFFDRIGRHAFAATVYGACGDDRAAHAIVTGLRAAVEHLTDVLGVPAFSELAQTGAAMTRSEAVGHAHVEIQRVRDTLDAPTT